MNVGPRLYIQRQNLDERTEDTRETARISTSVVPRARESVHTDLSHSSDTMSFLFSFPSNLVGWLGIKGVSVFISFSSMSNRRLPFTLRSLPFFLSSRCFATPRH